MSELLPVNKILETDSLLCFYHPQPTYPVHILLVPKKDIRDLSQLDPMKDEFLPDLFVTVSKLVDELGLEQKGYRLIINGGEYQEFPQLHFHLVSGK
jgi:histidine triad (HIT) family protein